MKTVLKSLLGKASVLIFTLITLLTCGVSSIYAKNNPVEVPNNKFGIHITNEKDLTDAAKLVNSGGGDWGYVTFVITESERDHNRWQQIFDQMRKLHLIPIVRIATKAEGENWKIPNEEEIDNWVSFLNSLNWIIQNRYVIIGNEPNHAKEWGGQLDPASYASYLNKFARALHESSPDFFVLPAGLDASAGSTGKTMDEATYIKRMLTAEPDLFDNLDGWTSHSYPNPDFAGKATDTGRGSVETFDWELSFLRSLEIYKDLPVFITETGWSNQKTGEDAIGEMYEYTFKNVWNDKRVVAVTPFILNYPNAPFSEFSWKKADGSFYPYFHKFVTIPKDTGKPVQKKSGQILGALAQPIVFSGSDFVGIIVAKNTGQSIWNVNDLNIVGDNGGLSFNNVLLFDIEPPKTGIIVFKASATQKTGLFIKSLYLSDAEGKRITNSFPIEALIVKANKMQLSSFFAKIGNYLRSGTILGP